MGGLPIGSSETSTEPFQDHAVKIRNFFTRDRQRIAAAVLNSTMYVPSVFGW
jgi:hypothetical protein